MQKEVKKTIKIYTLLLGLLLMGCEKSNDSVAQVPEATSVPDFSAIQNAQQKKARFFNFMRPIALTENKKIMDVHIWLSNLDVTAMSANDAKKFMGLADKYKIKTIDDKAMMKKMLLNCIDIVPVSLVLAQAANESSWGTSRFAKQGFNFFGQWCFTKGCGIVPSQRVTGMTHEVKKFSSVNQSVEGYIFNLNSNQSFEQFRTIRAEARAKHEKLTGYALVAGLIHYSERKQAYIDDIRAMIRQNKLGQYDALAK